MILINFLLSLFSLLVAQSAAKYVHVSPSKTSPQIGFSIKPQDYNALQRSFLMKTENKRIIRIYVLLLLFLFVLSFVLR